MFTVAFAVYRKDGMSREDFQQHYRDIHAPIGARLPGARSYRVLLVNQAVEARDEPDAIAIMDFDSEEDFQAATQSAEMAEGNEDAAKFTSHFGTYMVEALDVIPSHV